MTEKENAPNGRCITIEEAVREGGYVGPTQGVSMLPMLKEGRDSIVVRPKVERLKPLDVALYRRGDQYVLHRVIALIENGYVIRGDNCYSDEYIKEENVFGVLTEYFRGNEHILCTDPSYLRYARRRVKNYPARRFFLRVKGKIKSIAKKILRRK